MSKATDRWDQEQEVKRSIKERDGRRCRECGISEQEHVELTNKGLEVHRVIPGTQYRPSNCITLCKACHGKKPKTIEQLYWRNNPDADYAVLVDFIFCSPEERAMLAQLNEQARAANMDLYIYIRTVVFEHAASLPCDYTI